MTLLQQLQALAQSDTLPMHMPGHKRSTALAPYLDTLGADLDITEISGFGNLHDPEGILAERMTLAAKLWGSKKAWWLIGGSTAGLLAAIDAATNVGDKVLIARNCHKSVYNACMLCRLETAYIQPKLEGTADSAKAPAAPAEPAEPPKKFGMVAVSLGEGFSNIFRDLTVDHIVEGGQTMNPSVDDILSAINAVNAECVFVFPNNGNVIFAANQAAELAEKEVHVIPTKNVAMGIAAAVAFQEDLSGEENAANMTEAAEHVKTGTVTYAVRDSEYNGVQIKKDDIIGMHNGQISYSGSNVHDVVMEMIKAIVDEDAELITVYYGADTSKEDAEAITAEIGEQYPDCEMSCLPGGQPLYYYLIAVE